MFSLFYSAIERASFGTRLYVSAHSQPVAERGGYMALITATAESATMGIVAGVTRKACRRRSHLVRCGLAVTTLALQAGMCAGERKFGIKIMIEAPKRPTVWVVTALALRAEFALVMSILVAGSACLCGIAMRC